MMCCMRLLSYLIKTSVLLVSYLIKTSDLVVSFFRGSVPERREVVSRVHHGQSLSPHAPHTVIVPLEIGYSKHRLRFCGEDKTVFTPAPRSVLFHSSRIAIPEELRALLRAPRSFRVHEYSLHVTDALLPLSTHFIISHRTLTLTLTRVQESNNALGHRNCLDSRTLH
jgi:hypothetical protein